MRKLLCLLMIMALATLCSCHHRCGEKKWHEKGEGKHHKHEKGEAKGKYHHHGEGEKSEHEDND